MIKRGYVDSPDGQIHYRITGTGAPVIVLHSTPHSSEGMIPLLNELGKEMQAIGMDTMGYGQSDRPNPPYTTMEEFARSVTYLIKGLRLEKVHLFGQLTGSQIALQTAADYPDLVESVAVIESFNWNTPSRRAVHERLHRYHPRAEDGSHIMSMWNKYAGRGGDVKATELLFRGIFTVNDDTGAEVYEGMGWEGAGPYAMCRQEMWDVTPRIKVPAYIMYGPDSELHRALEKFMETLPRGKGTRDAQSMRSDVAALANDLISFYKNPGV